MATDTLLFIFALFDGGALLFLTVYYIITLSDLECDYINAFSCCTKLNTWVLPEVIAHGLLTSFLLFNGHWILFLLNATMAGWLIYSFMTKPSGNIGLFDPAEIHNRNTLKRHLKETMFKLVFHLLFFFVYLYCLIMALVSGS